MALTPATYRRLIRPLPSAAALTHGDQYRRSLHISAPTLGEPPGGYQRKPRPHLNDSDDPTHMTGKTGAQEEWPHRAGSHRVPARLRDHPAALGKGRATAVGHLRRRITHPEDRQPDRS